MPKEPALSITEGARVVGIVILSLPVMLSLPKLDRHKYFTSCVILRQAQDDFSFGKLRMTSFGGPALSKAEGPKNRIHYVED